MEIFHISPVSHIRGRRRKERVGASWPYLSYPIRARRRNIYGKSPHAFFFFFSSFSRTGLLLPPFSFSIYHVGKGRDVMSTFARLGKQGSICPLSPPNQCWYHCGPTPPRLVTSLVTGGETWLHQVFALSVPFFFTHHFNTCSCVSNCCTPAMSVGHAPGVTG